MWVTWSFVAAWSEPVCVRPDSRKALVRDARHALSWLPPSSPSAAFSPTPPGSVFRHQCLGMSISHLASVSASLPPESSGARRALPGVNQPLSMPSSLVPVRCPHRWCELRNGVASSSAWQMFCVAFPGGHCPPWCRLFRSWLLLPSLLLSLWPRFLLCAQEAVWFPSLGLITVTLCQPPPGRR